MFLDLEVSNPLKILCPYCGGSFDDFLENCPHCGAANEGIVRTASGQPLTIEELKRWYEARKLPSYEVTRFFLGVDYKGPRAFGIYKDETKNIFVVYKNKDDGSRAIRYSGSDEAYAVNELYQRLKQEILEQKSKNHVSSSSSKKKGNGQYLVFAFITAIIAIVLVNASSKTKSGPATGYYSYDDSSYYHIDDSYDHHNGHWYEYINDEWTMVDYEALPGSLQSEQAEDFYLTEYWDPSTQARDFSISQAAADYEQEADLWENQDDDSDYDWDDSSDWDSDSSDWSSDW